MSKYDAWIKANVQGTGAGRCKEETLAMLAAFPELTRIRGHYHDDSCGRRAHWWLTTPDNKIVDPTSMQFPSKGDGRYEPWVEGAPEPTGMCVECGEDTYNDEYFCSETCATLCLRSMQKDNY